MQLLIEHESDLHPKDNANVSRVAIFSNVTSITYVIIGNTVAHCLQRGSCQGGEDTVGEWG